MKRSGGKLGIVKRSVAGKLGILKISVAGKLGICEKKRSRKIGHCENKLCRKIGHFENKRCRKIGHCENLLLSLSIHRGANLSLGKSTQQNHMPFFLLFQQNRGSHPTHSVFHQIYFPHQDDETHTTHLATHHEGIGMAPFYLRKYFYLEYLVCIYTWSGAVIFAGGGGGTFSNNRFLNGGAHPLCRYAPQRLPSLPLLFRQERDKTLQKKYPLVFLAFFFVFLSNSSIPVERSIRSSAYCHCFVSMRAKVFSFS